MDDVMYLLLFQIDLVFTSSGINHYPKLEFAELDYHWKRILSCHSKHKSTWLKREEKENLKLVSWWLISHPCMHNNYQGAWPSNRNCLSFLLIIHNRSIVCKSEPAFWGLDLENGDHTCTVHLVLWWWDKVYDSFTGVNLVCGEARSLFAMLHRCPWVTEQMP